MRTRYATDVCHRFPALVGQMDRVDAAVLRIVATLDEPSLFELVKDSDEPAWHHAQQRGERLLTDAGVARDRAEGSSMCGDQLELL